MKWIICALCVVCSIVTVRHSGAEEKEKKKTTKKIKGRDKDGLGTPFWERKRKKKKKSRKISKSSTGENADNLKKEVGSLTYR